VKLKVRILKFLAGRPISIINKKTASKINLHVSERIMITQGKKSLISLIDTAAGLVKEDEIAVSNEIVENLCLKDGNLVEISLAQKPESSLFIKKKVDGNPLNKEELHSIIQDIVDNALTEAEIAYFVSAVYERGMNEKEKEYLISAMVNTGKKLKFKGKIVDKHSIGGISGNRTTPLVVSICASQGLIMPKTSSRAITTAAGTADVIEAIAKVEFSAEEIKKIVEKTGACMVWGGSLGLSPADDKLIQVERLLNLDPEPQLLASVLSKKISVGSKYVIIDIPYGKNAKVDLKRGTSLKKDFEKFGKKFGLKLKCVLTKGDEPIGNGIGPLLEIRDVIRVLERKNSPKDLENKAIFLAGQIFELVGKAKKGAGKKLALEALDSGAAMKKFEEIMKAQDGKVPSLESINSKLGKMKIDITADKNGAIKSINNKKINLIASIAGSPMDKGSGMYLYHHVGDKIKKGDKISTIYSESQIRLKGASQLFNKIMPVEL
jgi:AMP phosphorylase